MIIINILLSLGIFFIGLGTFFFVSGTIGYLKNSDFFIKFHAISLANIYGVNFILLGYGIKSLEPTILLNVLILIVLNTIIFLTISHILCRQAYLNGVKINAKNRKDIQAELEKTEQKK